jgi:hypothetical protein
MNTATVTFRMVGVVLRSSEMTAMDGKKEEEEKASDLKRQLCDNIQERGKHNLRASRAMKATIATIPFFLRSLNLAYISLALFSVSRTT